MGRKIGEIFKYEGDWYQCVENNKGNGCDGCSFYKKGMVCCECPIDCEGVIFKKLEPVGDPYPLYDHIVQRYAGVKFPVGLTEKLFINCNEINNTIDIEVKQDKENKEDMETNEKTMPVPDGWEFDRIDDSGNIVLKEKKKELPKTWEECCGVLDIKLSNVLDDGIHYRYAVPDNLRKPMLALCQLLICRNAWWKLLEWKPDWEKPEEKHCIVFKCDGVEKQVKTYESCILAFPKYEVRDKFLETFRDLIEEAKELL